jgi:hypothetical protein
LRGCVFFGFVSSVRFFQRSTLLLPACAVCPLCPAWAPGLACLLCLSVGVRIRVTRSSEKKISSHAGTLATATRACVGALGGEGGGSAQGRTAGHAFAKTSELKSTWASGFLACWTFGGTHLLRWIPRIKKKKTVERPRCPVSVGICVVGFSYTFPYCWEAAFNGKGHGGQGLPKVPPPLMVGPAQTALPVFLGGGEGAG